MLEKYNHCVVPLTAIGLFLNYCGNHILHYIYTIMKKRIFYPCHRVTSIQLLQNGEIMTSAVKTQVTIKKNGKGGEVTWTQQTQTVQFRSKAIVMSNGGKQMLPT